MECSEIIIPYEHKVDCVKPCHRHMQLLLNYFICHLISLWGLFLQSTEQSMKHLDMISPYETHKIGVIYIKPGQVLVHTDKCLVFCNAL